LAAALAVLLACDARYAGAVVRPFAEYAWLGFNQDRYLGSRMSAFRPYRALAFVRDNLPSGSRVLSVFEPQVYYAGCRVISSLMHDHSALDGVLESSGDLSGALARLDRMRVTHLLVCQAVDSQHAGQFFRFMSDRKRALLIELVTHGAVLLYEDERQFYSVYALKGKAAAARLTLPRDSG
jgi:hypothetical protein